MICELWRLFTVWARYREFDPFLNIDVDGRGWVGDGVGGTFFEFDNIGDGIEQIGAALRVKSDG